ncbi:MAG TPA: FAD-dependent oxidoreductase [Armatimonadota bacterium]|nr:FAD-dependent oxidoreductase [Armatimonadota bacterium]
MADFTCSYLIVGAGLAGASAVEGIRQQDREGAILLLGSEPYLPYHRPPLTKKLWFGKESVEQIFVHNDPFYADAQVDLKLGTVINALQAAEQVAIDTEGNRYHYEKLLLATGGAPRRLEIPGGDLEGICYYRYLTDYLRVRPDAERGKSAVVVGGGFIGSEIAAALAMQEVQVSLIFPGQYLVDRIFPEELGRSMTALYQQHGVQILAGDAPVAFERQHGKYLVHTKQGQLVTADMLIAGIGIYPETDLAAKAGLSISNGIVANEYLQTSDPHIYAAGDNAFFPYHVVGKGMRVEHWDNALNQGQAAGRNMSGAREPYTYMPYFFSDLFEFGYEAVGEVSAKLETFADWQQDHQTGVLYYLDHGLVRGVMTCNLYGKLDQARELIRSGRQMTPDQLRGAIREEKKAA